MQASSPAPILKANLLVALVGLATLTGCTGTPAHTGEASSNVATLPSPIHDERAVVAAAGSSDLGEGCSAARPCFDYPFDLSHAAVLRANLTGSGPTDGLAIEILSNGTRVAFAATSVPYVPTATLDLPLDAGAYLLQVHVYRMVNGRYLLDATFGEPPVPKILSGPDPLLGLQWGLPMARVPEAWALATGKNVTIAFIDSGIDLHHLEFAGRLVLLDESILVGDSMQDANGHGTHVAGIAAAAANNGVGIAGVAPDALVMPIRVLGVSSGPEVILEPDFNDRLAQAIRLAADHADIISMSVGTGVSGGTLLPPQIADALDYAWSHGAVMVGAAGNGYVVPVCADIAAHPHVLCVGAVGPTGQRAVYSHLDARQDFVLAPGGDEEGPDGQLLGEQLRNDCSAGVLSTVPANLASCPQQSDGGWYGWMSGTSMSAPFVAGIAALLVEQGLTNEQVVQRIRDTAVPAAGAEGILPDPNPVYGHGVVNAYCAVTNGLGEGCH